MQRSSRKLQNLCFLSTFSLINRLHSVNNGSLYCSSRPQHHNYVGKTKEIETNNKVVTPKFRIGLSCKFCTGAYCTGEKKGVTVLLESALSPKSSSAFAGRMGEEGGDTGHSDLILKSPNDKKQYRSITLENGLRALLIHDPSGKEEAEEDDEESGDSDEEMMSGDESGSGEEEEEEEDNEEDDKEKKGDKAKARSEKYSAAALCVGMGSFSDPPDIPGFAHFLEHMVFMGSEKYPDENDFGNTLSRHGGTTNAFTDLEHTVFYFDVQRKYFQDLLDRFAWFFIHPLLKQDSVDRELEAVDHEFTMSKLSDFARRQQLFSNMTKPNHPMGKFFWGNSQSLKSDPQSLGIDVYGKLRDFYKRMYSAHYMTLAVQSRDSLDVLEEWVREIFSAMPNNGLPRPSFHEMKEPFDVPDFYKMYKVIPIKKEHAVQLSWALPSLKEYYKVKPLHYLGWILGHEGKGSILSYLKKKCWALSISSGNDESGYEHNSTWAAFTLNIRLTDEGLSHLYEVLTSVFEYITMMQRSRPNERIFREIQAIEANDFRWQDEIDPVDYVERLCVNVLQYPVRDYLTGDILMFDYDEEIVSKVQNMLKPERVNITLSSESPEMQLDCIEVEKWFGTQYCVNDINPDWIKSWSNLEPGSQFFLPPENTFIATDFDLKTPDLETDSKLPLLILENERSKVWYKKDEKFKFPKAYYSFHLITPAVNRTPKNRVLFDIYMCLLKHNLADVAYDADVAQMDYTFKALETGMIIEVSGFNHKLHKLLETVVQHMIDFETKDDIFEAMRIQLTRTYHNLFIKPERLVKDVRLSILQNIHWTSLDKYEACQHVTKEDLLMFLQDFHSQLRVECLIMGNVLKQEALDLEKIFTSQLKYTPLPRNVQPVMRICDLPKTDHYCRVQNLREDDENCVITNYYQVGPLEDVGQGVLNEMLALAMEDPCFNILRTKKQLGYSVFAMNRNTADIIGLSVSVCSNSSQFSLEALDAHIEEFLQEFGQILTAMPEEDFEKQRDALIKRKEAEDANMRDEVNRYWDEMITRRYIFDILDQEIAALRKLTKTDVLDWYRKHTPFGNKAASKLSIQVQGHSKAMDTSGGADATDCCQATADTDTKMDTSSRSRLTYLPLEGNKVSKSISDVVDFKMNQSFYPVPKVVKI
ncbi:nardilysin-like [Lineus longissimus]|uniref:nardilysin-like n=1 Tax=Lineus longissimus TaxID=88925 RepID=UPI002B4E4D72